MKWYPRDPNAFLVGTVNLSDSAFRYYSIIIELLYARDGDLDDELVIKTRGRRAQSWRKAKAELIAKGKIRVLADGRLMANRVETELNSYVKRKYSGSDRAKINELRPPTSTTTSIYRRNTQSGGSKEASKQRVVEPTVDPDILEWMEQNERLKAERQAAAKKGNGSP